MWRATVALARSNNIPLIGVEDELDDFFGNLKCDFYNPDVAEIGFSMVSFLLFSLPFYLS
jgi:hypothetical protein